MAAVEVTIPSMLATLVGGDRRFVVEADDLAQVISAVFDRHPELRVHVLDEDGGLRPHVMLFHSGRAVRTLEGPVVEGDTVTVLQAVSGGEPVGQARTQE
jgi:molybdopterin converting factor small subunit